MNSTTALLPRRGLLATCALAAVLNLATAAAALADDRLVQVDVLDRDDGRALHVWRDHGRPVVAGRPGARYALRLVNNSGERVLAVVAIDGVNVVSGETAAVGQRGYVLAPWQRTDVTGWRKSDDEVAAFEFTALSDSYAARTGRPRDVGVIGVAVFREAPLREVEQAPPPAPRPLPAPRLEGLAKALPAAPDAAAPATAAAPAQEARRAADAAPGEAAQAARGRAERLGTGHGERETSVVRVTTFERASTRPDQRIEIRYDSLDNLVAAGIVPPPRVAAAPPNAFPADPPRGYVPDPPQR
jgi:pyruvate/2-oxoglutarate dehydrogenase complex dihydrolipoamide acyltransferase (E2) component